MISTTEKPEDKREKRRKLREFHQAELDKIGPTAVFIPKMSYRPYGKTEHHIAFFASEVSKGEDVYVEFCSKDDVPEDPERTLYKWKFNPHFDGEYEKTEPNPTTGHCRYLIPIEELHVVKKYTEETPVEEEEKEEFQLEDPNTDAPLNTMTIRDVAALLLKKPVSNKPWLNSIISKKK